MRVFLLVIVEEFISCGDVNSATFLPMSPSQMVRTGIPDNSVRTLYF